MTEATDNMLSDLSGEIERLEAKVAEHDKAAREWQERARKWQERVEKAEKFSFEMWWAYMLPTLFMGVFLTFIGIGLWHFIHWAARPDDTTMPNVSSMSC